MGTHDYHIRSRDLLCYPGCPGRRSKNYWSAGKLIRVDDMDGLAISAGLRDVCPSEGYDVSPFRRLPKGRLIRQLAMSVAVAAAQRGYV